MFKPLILSRHPSHRILRSMLPKLPVRSVVRLGSTTELKDGKNRVEINSVDSVKISSNKQLMKEAFDAAGCPTAPWTTADDVDELLELIEHENIRFPIVAKHIYGSRGTGNSLLRREADLGGWAANGRNFANYIFENYVNYLMEFRLHVTPLGAFYTGRKAIKKGTDKLNSWQRHLNNCVWFVETNPDFNRPNSWDDVISSCVKALKQMTADLLCFDIRVQSAVDKNGEPREYQNFVLIESNSAASLNNPEKEVSVCASKYMDVIPHLIMAKHEKLYD